MSEYKEKLLASAKGMDSYSFQDWLIAKLEYAERTIQRVEGDLIQSNAERDRYYERIQELIVENNKLFDLSSRMRCAIGYLYDQCDNVPHADNCDVDNTGYCTCARAEFNSLVVNYHAEFQGKL